MQIEVQHYSMTIFFIVISHQSKVLNNSRPNLILAIIYQVWINLLCLYIIIKVVFFLQKYKYVNVSGYFPTKRSQLILCYFITQLWHRLTKY